MDEKTARLMDALRRDPTLLQGLLRSPDGQALLQLLNQSSDASPLRSAAESASRGNSADAVQQVRQYLQTPDGAALAERIHRLFRK